jgi:hypothetical protein
MAVSYRDGLSRRGRQRQGAGIWEEAWRRGADARGRGCCPKRSSEHQRGRVEETRTRGARVSSGATRRRRDHTGLASRIFFFFLVSTVAPSSILSTLHTAGTRD